MPIKPGWVVLALVVLFAFWQTAQLISARRQLGVARAEILKLRQPPPKPPESFIFPLPGACLPKTAANLPDAPREYRKGKNPGFVFLNADACVPVVYGTGVVAASSGTVVKADTSYKELSSKDFQALLKAVAKGASPEQMNRLQGRQVWIRHAGGLTSVYAHLSAIAPGIKVGGAVEKGQWIGRVGNSGTEYGVLGQQSGARLLFELWDGEPNKDRYFGQGVPVEALRAKAKLEFGLP
ncbi:MAG: M23 family metallopeptidase [Thermaceae bacterium]|nr:M23 family metallopeptidase [Thermaceae bacterium]